MANMYTADHQNPKFCNKPLLMTEAILFTTVKQPGRWRELAREGQNGAKHRTAGGI